MNELFRACAYGFLVLRALIDLGLSAVIYYQVRNIVAAVALLPICGVFYVFLYFGLKNESFRGRYGSQIFLWREPVAYWFIVGLLVVLHLVMTWLLVMIIYWQAT